GVIGLIAGNGVGHAVAGSADRPGARHQSQILDVGRQCIADRGIDEIAALAGVLDDDVANVVDEIDVVAGAPEHSIRAGPTPQGVVAAVADKGVVVVAAIERVVVGVSDQQVLLVVSHAGNGSAGLQQIQLLDVGAQHVVRVGIDGVDALV